MALLDQPSVSTEIINLTAPAANAVQGLLQKRELSPDEYSLRVFISGGGCAGFQYGMALENQVRETDFTVTAFGVQVVVDEVSLDYLRGATVDYVEDIMGSGFKIDNPNAVAACGCGSSFRTKDSGAAPAGGGCGGY